MDSLARRLDLSGVQEALGGAITGWNRFRGSATQPESIAAAPAIKSMSAANRVLMGIVTHVEIGEYCNGCSAISQVDSMTHA